MKGGVGRPAGSRTAPMGEYVGTWVVTPIQEPSSGKETFA